MNLLCLISAVGLALTFSAIADDTAGPMQAAELASRLAALQQDGASYVRLKMEINGTAKETLQLQIKQRRTKNAIEVVYQVLYPKERKGESVLLRKIGTRPASGTAYTPPGTIRTIESMKEPLFDSDLSYGDVIENFFGWDQQAIVGVETVDDVNCTIVESKPGKGERSTYGSVRSWIDTRRMVPIRVEKYSSSGQLVRRIDTTRVVTDTGRQIPANLTVRDARQNSSTDLDGSRIRHDVNYTDADFTVEGIKKVSSPHGSPE